MIDARDLASWVVQMVEAAGRGVYNATGPEGPLTMGRVLDECRSVTKSETRFVWVDDEFLVDNGAEPWTEVPLWLPESDSESRGLMEIDVSRAVRGGLSFRPVAETIADTLEWDLTRPAAARREALSREKERTLLQRWRRVGSAEEGQD
jgi:2'-hydroxyisoflavone reductase